MGKVSVVYEFDSPEAAIAALGKHAGLAPAAEKAPRKPRADAGKERGPHKDKPPVGQPPVVPPVVKGTAASEPALAGSEAGATVAPVAAVAGAPAAAVAVPAASPEQTQAAMEELFNAKGLETAKLVLSRFGAPRVRDLLPEQRAEFVVKAKAVAALPEKQGTPEFDTKVQAVFAPA